MGLAVFERSSVADIGRTLFSASELVMATRAAGGDVAMAAVRNGRHH